ncbi:MAG: restriction endonuclease [Selenomonadaceae bacterium]|nr:restriction endonuclease [Selenomonadaceae bacterium]
MNLHFDESVALDYKSPSQKIRVMSERWFLSNIFCPCCGNDHVDKLKNNSPVADMRCGNCGEIFEAKSKKNHLGAKIPDGAYHTMIERITGNLNPQLFVMQYSPALTVRDLIFIPKFFFTPDIIEKRKPLSATARRAGWVGCNILYQKIPEQGRIDIIRDGREFEIADVLQRYRKIEALKTDNLKLRGWLLDVLNCVNAIKSETFTLQEIYQYADFLKAKHALNNNVEPKIRQQLQFLRDKGFIEFVGRGVYRKLQ